MTRQRPLPYGYKPEPKRRWSWAFLAIIIAACLIAAFSLRRQLGGPSGPANADPLSALKQAVEPTPSPTPVPSSWQTYADASETFSFRYPPSWGIDDSELAQFGSLHAAFTNYSNMVTAYSSKAAEDDPTQGPSITLNIASESDVESQISSTFATSKQWLMDSSTGLPSGSSVSSLQIGGNTAAVLGSLNVLKGKYEAIYLLDIPNAGTVRFDCMYDDDSDLATLDMIAQSFRFTKSLEKP